ncbi:hypothetical protein K3495_g613 [Podosphaera aphanis]|nr:hypothetical protein K3495_g613 [Podosphaera aphanis]
MRDLEENCVIIEGSKDPGPSINESPRTKSQHTSISGGCRHSHFIRKNVATNCLGTCLTTSSLNHKVSQDKVSKPSNRKKIMKSREIETPSKEATKMLGSMEICRHQEVRSDTTMLDVLENDEACFDSKQVDEIEKKQLTNGSENEYNKEVLWAQRSEYAKEIARTVGPDHPSIPTSFNSMEKSRKKYAGGPVDPNGRCKGRKLVLWHSKFCIPSLSSFPHLAKQLKGLGPRMMEKLLLNVQYECFKAKLRIPWDEIVHRLEPGCSGPSAVQMLNKLRDVLITEGHMIPPAMGNGIQPDPDVRGYVRDLESGIPGSTRILRWDENYPNASESLCDSGFVRGSGNYRKVVTKGGAFNKIPRTIEERGYARKVIPEEAYGSASSRIQTSGRTTEKANQTRVSRGKPRSLWKKPGPKIGSKSRSKSLPTSSSHTSLSLGDTFPDTGADPETEFDHPSSAKTSVREHSMNGGTCSDNCDCAQQKLEFRSSSPAKKSTVKAEVSDIKLEKHFHGVQDEYLKIHLSPAKLARIDNDLPVYNCNPLSIHPISGVDMAAVYENNKQKLPKTPMQLFLGEYSSKKIHDQQYKGVQEHGTLEDFARALASGTDPRLNGWSYLNLAEMSGKMEGGNSVDHNAELSIGSELGGLPASDEFLDQFDESKRSETITRAFRQDHDVISWIYPGIDSEQQVTQQGITDDISYQHINPESYYSTEDDNQYLSQQSQKADESEKLNSLNDKLYNSPRIIKDTELECHFSSSSLIFENKNVESPSKMNTQSRPDVPDLFSDFENVESDEFHPSSWQNEFLGEQANCHLDIQRS